jgi:hypothetical protein
MIADSQLYIEKPDAISADEKTMSRKALDGI